jgi:hypothetical protein
MRTWAPEQRLAIKAPHRFDRIRVFIGAQEWTNLYGRNWLISASIQSDEDQPAGTANLTFVREADGVTLTPLPITSQPFVGPGSSVTILAAIGELGGELTEEVQVFDGRVDDISFGGDESVISITARDLMGRLHDSWVEEFTAYSGDVASISQAIMAEWLPEVELITTGVAGPNLEDIPFRPQTVYAAIAGMADLIGADLRSRWVDADETKPGRWAIVMSIPQDPGLSIPPALDIFSFNDYYEVSNFAINGLGIRDRVIVGFKSGDTDITLTRSTENPVLGGTYRPVYIDERSNPAVTSTGAAEALADAMLRAVARAPLIQTVEGPFDWRMELGDWLIYNPNQVHNQTSFAGAVTGISHQISAKGNTTTLRVRGSFAGGSQRWVSRVVKSKDADDDLTLGASDWFYTNPVIGGGRKGPSTPAQSLGGYLSTSSIQGGINNLFGPYTAQQVQAGFTEYRSIVLVNRREVRWGPIKMWMEAANPGPSGTPSEGGYNIAYALDRRGLVGITGGGIQGDVSAQPNLPPDTFTDPPYTFVSIWGKNNAIDIPEMDERQCIVIHVRLTVNAGAYRVINDRLIAQDC